MSKKETTNPKEVRNQNYEAKKMNTSENFKKKKDKDPNRWAVDPAKAAAKAEKARLKALAKAEAEKADVRTPRVETTVASMASRFHDVTR